MAKVFSNGKFGYINKLGEEIIPLKYDYADSFNEGIAVVELNNKKLYINKLGEEVIPLKNEKIKEKSTETILEKKCKYINNNKKKEIILCQYDRATDFCNGLALVQTGNICYFITPKGERLLETTIDGELQISSGQG